ncbi:LysM peptidoglycan-binding domain-containing protein [Geobacter sp.]|uniref:LysM peptidoglycan-binding domain-containing protein n=1 Tax=Geobacter sp. TaxID=46610 RepID=UPI0027BA2E19|nr:LysM peptidoglycan-binding domain-containing protein [Geobacter sp.]
MEALNRSYAVRMQGGEQSKPEEYASIVDALEAGDRFLLHNEVEGAERFYLLALRKAELVERQIEDERKQLEVQRLKADEERREAEQQKALQELKRKQVERQEKEVREARKKIERVLPVKEKERDVRPLPLYHTVKRGETLPQISAQLEVYGDATLWPILYRSNRDQIRDPRRIWPGQVLRIPRNIGREDIAEARRYAQERQLP